MVILGLTVTFSEAAATLVAAALFHGTYKLYTARNKFLSLQREHGFKSLPHSFLFGHLLELGGALAEQGCPSAHKQLALPLLLEEYPELWEQGFVYLDLWPVQEPMMAVYDPRLCKQFIQDDNQPKSVIGIKQFRGISGGADLASTDGPTWRKWRSIFNPGFSAKNIGTLVPSFVTEILAFRQILRDAADGDKVLKLSGLTNKLAFDVIVNAVLGARLHSLKGQSSFYDNFFRRLGWNYADWGLQNASKVFNPIRPLLTRYYDRATNNELTRHIDQAIKDQGRSDGAKTVLHLAIKAYLKETPSGARTPESTTDLSPSFLTDALAHLKIFLLAGYDTTSYVMCNTFWCLYRNPEALAKARDEHNKVLGADLTLAEQRIKDNPALLSQLPYTTAVIKEAMRMQTPTGVVRDPRADFVLVDPNTQQQLPTKGWTLYVAVHAVHRHPLLWPRRDEFLPERWLVPEGHELHPVKNAFRPFEHGPRNCIGQELAQTEVRAVMALTLREFDLVPQYDQDGPRLYGELAYQEQAAVTAQPKDGLPVKIARRELV